MIHVQMIRGNYSMINTYQNCNYQAYRRYVTKDVQYIESAKQRMGNDGHAAVDKRLASGTLLPAEFAKYEPVCQTLDAYKPQTELRLGIRENGEPCGYYDEDCWINCRVDVWCEVPGSGLIVDWKWAKRREDPFELRVNALLLYARNPELRSIKGRYFWANDGAAGELGSEHDCSDVERTAAELDSIMSHIENSAAMNYWPKREGPLCAYCNVLDCEFNKHPDKGNGRDNDHAAAGQRDALRSTMEVQRGGSQS